MRQLINHVGQKLGGTVPTRTVLTRDHFTLLEAGVFRGGGQLFRMVFFPGWELSMGSLLVIIDPMCTN